VQVDGRPASLYPAPDGSGRYYLEARRGARYELEVRNRTGQRIGVLLAVDGLNVVSGERQHVGQPGRMYVLGPWDDVTVRGWRSSMEEVRQFTFVDEQRSYAARTDKANGKMGWIELAVYRERPPAYVHRPWVDEDRAAGPSAAPRERAEGGRAAEKRAGDSRAADTESERVGSLGYTGGQAPAASAPPRRESFPGTGWGERRHDPVVTVQFDAESAPAETLNLRYEYRSALVRLGVLPRHWPQRDRLAERERGRDGFAQPPIR
jgi:hypothetical protein